MTYIPGPNGIPGRAWIQRLKFLWPRLAGLYSACLEQSQWPSRWKTGMTEFPNQRQHTTPLRYWTRPATVSFFLNIKYLGFVFDSWDFRQNFRLLDWVQFGYKIAGAGKLSN